MIMRKCDIFTEKKNYSYSCSVAISTYNGEEYIQKQLESLRNQSHMVDEVIITDDGSSDKTVQIVQQFIDDNLLQGWHLIQNSNNLGYTKNFEKCVPYVVVILYFCVIKMIYGLLKKFNVY